MDTMPAASAIPERSEPTLDPVPAAPQMPIEPHIEPVISAEPEEAVSADAAHPEESEPISEPEVSAPETVVADEAPPEEDDINDEVAPADEPVLGEDRSAVPKSRRKRPMLRRRPERLRTARRRE